MIRRSRDLELVARLDRETFPLDAPLTASELQRGLWWVAYEGAEPIAFAGGVRKGPAFEVLRVGVLEKHRGRGLQRTLLNRAFRFVRRAGAVRAETYVAYDNTASFRSLTQLGMHPIGAFTSNDQAFVQLRRDF